MANSLRTDPRALRAARRASFPVLRARPPSPGREHPASIADVRRVLESLGPSIYYGLRRVELVPAPPADGSMRFGGLIGPGCIVLYDLPPSPWRLGMMLPESDRQRLLAAGAVIDDPSVVVWPSGTLRAFMVRHVLTHELAHHMLQHERRRPRQRVLRTSDHERQAAIIATRLARRIA